MKVDLQNDTQGSSLTVKIRIDESRDLEILGEDRKAIYSAVDTLMQLVESAVPLPRLHGPPHPLELGWEPVFTDTREDPVAWLEVSPYRIDEQAIFQYQTWTPDPSPPYPAPVHPEDRRPRWYDSAAWLDPSTTTWSCEWVPMSKPPWWKRLLRLD